MTKTLNTVTSVNIAGIRRSLELARHANRTLGEKAADGTKARPSVGQLNDTLDDLATITLLLEDVMANLCELPAIPHASDVEKRIVGKLVTDLLAAGFNITIDDGGGVAESPLKRSQDAAAIFEALSSTDSDRLYVDAGHRVGYTGWVYLVWGNDDCVISDYTTNLEPHIEAANKLAEELEA